MIRSRLSPWFRPIALAVTLIAAPAPASAEDAGTVHGLIADRLALMKPVAAWKMDRGAPVEDLEREAVVLDKAVASAEENGLDGATARPFFEAQIAAAKAIQTCWIGRWGYGEATPPTEVPDLREEIRPQLIDLGARMLEAIGGALEAGVTFDGAGKAAFDERVDLPCLDRFSRLRIYTALGGIKRSP
ncbi:MAG: gamma subclass chorismate mutase AroQ [Pseudomonadota bacterium]